MTLKEAIAAYTARKARCGVEIPGGYCIAADHTGHGHKEKEGCPANDGGSHCYVSVNPDSLDRECVNCGEPEGLYK